MMIKNTTNEIEKKERRKKKKKKKKKKRKEKKNPNKITDNMQYNIYL